IPGVPYLEVIATVNKSGDRLTLFCINRNLTRDITARINWGESFHAASKTHVEQLYSDSIYDVNDEVTPKHITPIETTIETRGSGLDFTFRHESIVRIEVPGR
ncbi:MAG: hypothetical protein ACRD23_13060, partial [Terriglobales bacterium]